MSDDHTPHSARTTAALLALLLGPACLAGLEAPQITAAAVSIGADPVERAILDLASDDFARREAACVALTDESLCTEAQLIDALKNRAMLAEQRARVLTTLRDRFLRSERAAVGISMETVEEGVRISQLHEPFPARAILQPNDVILEISGRRLALDPRDPLTPTARLQIEILAHSPGERARMRIQRADETLELDVPLGSRADLPAPPAPTFGVSDAMDAAWRARMQRLGVAESTEPPIVALARANDWRRSGRHAVLPGPQESVAAGGQWDEDLETLIRRRQRAALNREAFRQGGANMKIVVLEPEEPAPGNAAAPRAVPMNDSLATLRQAVAELEARLAEPGLDPRVRQALIENLVIKRQALEGLEALVDQMKQGPAEPEPRPR